MNRVDRVDMPLQSIKTGQTVSGQEWTGVDKEWTEWTRSGQECLNNTKHCNEVYRYPVHLSTLSTHYFVVPEKCEKTKKVTLTVGYVVTERIDDESLSID